MKRRFFYLIFLVMITSCIQICNFRDVSPQIGSILEEADYNVDKERLAECFITNVEYFRKFHIFDKKIYVNSPDSVKKEHEAYYAQYPGADRDPSNIFIPFATRYSTKKEAFVGSPLPTKDQITVKTDTIIYDGEGVFCVAFLVIHSHYDEISELRNEPGVGREFDAVAIIGYRESPEKQFDIYPLTQHQVVGFESHEAAAIMLKDLFFNHLKGKGSTGTVYEGEKFKHNVGDKDFFRYSPYFQKHSSGYYNFQMYRYFGKDFKYNYLECSR